MSDNPYQPPVPVEDAGGQHSTLSMLCCWSGLACLLLGVAAIFVRNAPPLGLLLIATVLLSIACLHQSWRYRGAAISCLLLCLLTMVGTIFLLRQRAVRSEEIEAQRQEMLRSAQQAISGRQP